MSGRLDSIAVEVPTPEYWQRQVKCQEACPVHTDSRGYVRAIAAGRYEEAYLIARGPNPLASICGRVCGAPCEAACRRGSLDEAVSIRALKRFVTDQFGGSVAARIRSPFDLIQRLLSHASQRESSRSEELAAFREFLSNRDLSNREPRQKIAIIGSGPAGLAAAHDLALMGFQPVVFEMEPVPAGMLAVGIPKYRLPNDLIAAEVDFIRSLGVEFRCNVQVGRDLTLADIRKEHVATIIAVGMKRSRSLPIPGAEGKRVLGGVELLRDVAIGEASDADPDQKPLGRVVVIGGGNVAYDVARTVVRQTGVDISRTALREPEVAEVHLCSLESLEELPADDQEILEGDEEGVVRHHGLGPKEILLDDDGYPRAVVFQQCLHVFDDQGRFAPEFDTTNLTTVPADTVIWSVGQQADLTLLEDADDIERSERGFPICDPQTCRTTASDVYLAGDIAYGAKLLIDAVASGKQVARSIYQSLNQRKIVEQVRIEHEVLRDYGREFDYEKLPRNRIPTASAKERLQNQLNVVELGFDEPQAVCEGCRCLDCDVNTIFDSNKCILCGGCADVCPEKCLRLVSLDRLTGDNALQRTLDDRLGSAAPAGSAIIKDETACIRCGLCAERCPVGAITMERMHLTSRWCAEPVGSSKVGGSSDDS